MFSLFSSWWWNGKIELFSQLDDSVRTFQTGMSYDKCGAANVAGFFKILSELQPKNFKAFGVLAVTRNNCGEEAYATDEILKSRAGIRIRVGNTDAEGNVRREMFSK